MPSVIPSVQTVTVGETAQFRCSAHGDPPAVIEWGWQVPAGPLRKEIRQSDGLLTITPTRFEDAGTYHCTASNQHGTQSIPVTLHVVERKSHG